MDVFGRGTDEPSRPLLTPGICWVCENSPQQEGMKVIDTRRNARAGGSMSHEAVRKYICEPCARELGAAVDMVTPEEAAEISKELSDAQFEAIALSERLEAAEAGQVKVVDPRPFIEQMKAEMDAFRAEVEAETANPRTSYGDSVPPPSE